MSSRLTRFRRTDSVGAIQLTDRDRHIIHLIQRHRFLRSSHILLLVNGSPQQILRRLQLLYHHDYLERPKQQLDYFHNGGSRRIVYGIGTSGAALLNEEFGIPIEKLNWSAKNRSVGRIFLEHALLVSDVMVKIELACRANDHTKLLLPHDLSFPKRRRQPLKWEVDLHNGGKTGVVPDRVFGLEYSDRTGNRERAFFFLEADRGTMPVIRRNFSQTSFYRKLLAYELTWSQGIHKTHLGFHRFRVLTVTTTAKRVSSLVQACSKLKTGHGLFLFTDRPSFEEITDIFSLMWQTPRLGHTATLLS